MHFKYYEMNQLSQHCSFKINETCFGMKSLRFSKTDAIIVWREQMFIGLFLPNISNINRHFPICFSVIFAHASFRLRNMKNKLENKIEGAGLKRSPMGILLEALGQQEENFQKIQSFLEGKLKEWFDLERSRHTCTCVLLLAKDLDFFSWM